MNATNPAYTTAQLRRFFNVERLARRSPTEIPNVGRDTLAQFFGAMHFEIGAEIGTEQGGFAEVLCRANPTARLISVDAWAAYPGYRDHVTQSKLDGFFEKVQERLAAWPVTYIRNWSIDASRLIDDGSLDYVYIDANHSLPHVIADLCAWVPKVRKGGIIAGHDFVRRKRARDQVHVVEAVHAFTEAYHIDDWYVLGSKDIVPGEIRDTPRSYMWVQS